MRWVVMMVVERGVFLSTCVVGVEEEKRRLVPDEDMVNVISTRDSAVSHSSGYI